MAILFNIWLWVIIAVAALLLLFTQLAMFRAWRRVKHRTILPTEAPDQISDQTESVLPVSMSLDFDLDDEPISSVDPDPTLNESIEPASTDVVQPVVLTLYVMASSGDHFHGYELQQALADVGLSFGQMNIFHGYQEDKLLFSVAQATEPGTFDWDQMGALRCQGLCLFAQLTGDSCHQDQWDAMWAAAESLAEALFAEIYDDQKSLFDQTSQARYQGRIHSDPSHSSVST